MSNKDTYNDSEIVNSYAREYQLQSPEKTILSLLKQKNIENMTMLDIGVGGGRTTLHFAQHVQKYIAIDYSMEMIDSCKQKFLNETNNVSFYWSDVCDMSIFEDNTFDLILFSFNGLDYISHDDRLKALIEIHRVAKPNAFFCFSTHNLQCSEKIFNIKNQFSFNPKKILVNMYYWFNVRFLYNKDLTSFKFRDVPFIILNDGGHHFQLDTYYITPGEQIKQLEPYFNDINIFSFDTGEEVVDKEILTQIDDRWLYYLCRVK